jgi:hypothetical protein
MFIISSVLYVQESKRYIFVERKAWNQIIWLALGYNKTDENVKILKQYILELYLDYTYNNNIDHSIWRARLAELNPLTEDSIDFSIRTFSNSLNFTFDYERRAFVRSSILPSSSAYGVEQNFEFHDAEDLEFFDHANTAVYNNESEYFDPDEMELREREFLAQRKFSDLLRDMLNQARSTSPNAAKIIRYIGFNQIIRKLKNFFINLKLKYIDPLEFKIIYYLLKKYDLYGVIYHLKLPFATSPLPIRCVLCPDCNSLHVEKVCYTKHFKQGLEEHQNQYFCFVTGMVFRKHNMIFRDPLTYFGINVTQKLDYKDRFFNLPELRSRLHRLKECESSMINYVRANRLTCSDNNNSIELTRYVNNKMYLVRYANLYDIPNLFQRYSNYCERRVDLFEIVREFLFYEGWNGVDNIPFFSLGVV